MAPKAADRRTDVRGLNPVLQALRTGPRRSRSKRLKGRTAIISTHKAPKVRPDRAWVAKDDAEQGWGLLVGQPHRGVRGGVNGGRALSAASGELIVRAEPTGSAGRFDCDR